MGVCSVEGCDRPVTYKRGQLCSGHRRQQLNGQPLTEIKRRRAPEGLCEFEGCDQPKRALQWCATHYLQQYHGRQMRTPKRRHPVTRRDPQGRKWCSTCDVWRPEAAFASSKGKADGLQVRCRDCNAAIYAERAELIRDKMREQRLNLTRGQFDAMLAAQGYGCAICGTTEPGRTYWCVDHDHSCCPDAGVSCGECIRGILCRRCNQGIGFLDDDPARMLRAVEYVQGTRHSRAAITRGAR